HHEAILERHFLNKICKIKKKEYKKLYDYHLNFYLGKEKDGAIKKERRFFLYIYETVAHDLFILDLHGRPRGSSIRKLKRHLNRQLKLTEFMVFLEDINKWGIKHVAMQAAFYIIDPEEP